MTKQFVTACIASALVVLGLTGCQSTNSPQKPLDSTVESAEENTAQSDQLRVLTTDELALVADLLSSHSDGKTISPVVSGSYLSVKDSDLILGLTEIKLEDGSNLYFASTGSGPFGSSESGLVAGANQETVDITGFGEKVDPNSPIRSKGNQAYLSNLSKFS